MSLLILLSFLFYAPVVLFSDTYPIVGALMMPKTVAYLMIVILGYKYFIDEFTGKNILGLSFTLLIMGLIGGIFYREFTKFYNFTEITHLGKIHVHLLALGFITMIILYLLTKSYDKKALESLKKPIYTYIGGLSLAVVCMIIIGIFEIVSKGQKTISLAAIDGISGLGHITLAVDLVLTLVKIYNIEKLKSHTI